jgi:endonuclease YncB( thermonuclease family)
LGKIVQFRRDLRRRLRPWHAFGATLFLGLLIAIGIGVYSQFATTDSGSAGLLRIFGPKVSSQPIVGQASVVDGDTIEIHGTRIRLFGIDAPEGAQTCTVQGKATPCGRRAAFALATKIGRQVVECRPKDEDRYGRVVAVCGVGGEDINAWMVAQGWALAYRYYSRDYVSQEQSASKAKLGLWQGEFEPPWDWRHKNPQPPTQRSGQPARLVEPPAVLGGKDFAGASNGCAIKGNINARGRIYHMPGDESYAKTGINPAKGERWFCTEAEAQAAGWRRARR